MTNFRKLEREAKIQAYIDFLKSSGGATINELATHFRVTTTTVRNYLHKIGDNVMVKVVEGEAKYVYTNRQM